MPFEIIPVKSFLDDLKSLSKKYPSLKDDIESVVGELKSNPKIG